MSEKLITEFTNEELVRAIQLTINNEWRNIDDVDHDKYDDIDLLEYSRMDLLYEWHDRICNYVGIAVFGPSESMHHLYRDWKEFSLHWWLYPGCINMVFEYLNELENKWFGEWRTSTNHAQYGAQYVMLDDITA